MQDEYKTEPGTVIAADFYHSNTLMPLSDAEIVAKVKGNLDHCEPIFRSAQVGLTHTCKSLHVIYLLNCCVCLFGGISVSKSQVEATA